MFEGFDTLDPTDILSNLKGRETIDDDACSTYSLNSFTSNESPQRIISPGEYPRLSMPKAKVNEVFHKTPTPKRSRKKRAVVGFPHSTSPEREWLGTLRLSKPRKRDWKPASKTVELSAPAPIPSRNMNYTLTTCDIAQAQPARNTVPNTHTSVVPKPKSNPRVDEIKKVVETKDTRRLVKLLREMSRFTKRNVPEAKTPDVFNRLYKSKKTKKTVALQKEAIKRNVLSQFIAEEEMMSRLR
ncbi:hypothetical protein PCE1_004684 [Barthelona sp. PCE]